LTSYEYYSKAIAKNGKECFADKRPPMTQSLYMN